MANDEHAILRTYPLTCSIIGVIHTLLCAGIVFGWASLLPILQDEGISLSASSSATVFSFGAIGNYLSNLPFGLLLDRGGPKLCGIIASVLFALGLVLCSRATESITCLTVGFGLLGFVGPAIQIPTLHHAKLWDSGAALLMGAQAAAFDGGTAVFCIALFLHQAFGLNSATFFQVYLIVPLFTLLTAIFVWPSSSLKDEDTDLSENSSSLNESFDDSLNHSRRLRSNSLGGAGSPFLTKFSMQEVKLKDAPLSTILTKPPFWCLSIWVSIHILKLNFVVATINHQLDEAFDPSTKDQLINIFGIMLPFGFVIMPLAAYLLEKSPVQALQLANVFGVIYGAVLALASSQKWLEATIVFPLVATSRQLVYSAVFHQIGELFGFSNYGFLLGLVNVMVSLVSLTQNVLVIWAEQEGTYFSSNLFLLLATIPLFFIAWWVFRPVRIQQMKKMKHTYGSIEQT